jgi:hypothetical protein
MTDDSLIAFLKWRLPAGRDELPLIRGIAGQMQRIHSTERSQADFAPSPLQLCRPRGHKDRGILTEPNEANEGLSHAKTNSGRLPFITFCKRSSVFVAFVIFPYCANRIGHQPLTFGHFPETLSCVLRKGAFSHSPIRRIA